MAGAGYKLFNTGDVLTAAQVNTYLQEQVVMVFADAAARTTALSGVLAEGMLSYLKDTDAVQYYNGSSWTTINTDQTPLTTKGDLFTYSTTDARLAVGNNGETLVADSSTSTGLRYNPQNALANPVINGGMDIWQRGTSISAAASTAAYTADRWYVKTNASQASTVARQATGDTTNIPNVQYSLRLQRNSGQTGTGFLGIVENLETVNSIPFAGKTITLSFYAKCGANFSAASSALYAGVNSGTGTDENLFLGYTGNNNVNGTNVTVSTTWQRFALTGTVPANATELAIQFGFTPVGTASTNDWVEITGVQIDLGTYTASSAPTFRRAGGTIAGELAACQRYYTRFANGAAYARYGYGFTTSTTNANVGIPLPVTMRVTPTALDSGGNWQVMDVTSTGGSSSVTSFGLIANNSSPSQVVFDVNAASGLTDDRFCMIRANNDSTAYIGFSSEL